MAPSRLGSKERRELPKLWSPDQVAVRLGVTRRAVYCMVNRGEFSQKCIVKLGTRLRFDVEALGTWMADKRGRG